MMKRFVLAMSAVAVVAVMSAFGGGVAAAAGPEPNGKTYSDAAKEIKAWGWKATIATIVGAQTSLDNCIVTNSRKSGNLNSSGRSQGSVMLLDLDCNATVAAPGKPGNSAASSKGQEAKKELAALAWFAEDPEQNCGSTASYCKQLCQKYGDTCSPNVQHFVGLS
jgi:hypothetical protein